MGAPRKRKAREMDDSLFLSLLVIGSVLLFGSVEAWSLLLAGSAILLYFNLRLRLPAGSAGLAGAVFHLPDGMKLSAAGFLILVFFQLVPLPVPLIIKIFSPREYFFLRELSFTGGGSPAWHSLSIDSYRTMAAAVRLVLYMMVFSIALMAAGDRGALSRALSVLAFFGLALTVFAVVQRAASNGRIYWFRTPRSGGLPFGPFVDRDDFAGFEGMVFPLGLALALEMRRAEKALLLVFASAVAAAGIFCSRSRGGVLGMSASFFVFLLLAYLKGRKRKPGRNAVFLISFFAAGLIFLLARIGVSAVLDRFAPGMLAADQRMAIWKGALAAAMDFKWFGTGLGTFRDIFPPYNPGIQQEVSFAHNDYLNLAVETGMAGLMAVLIFFASFAKGVYNCFRKGNARYITCGLAASVAHMLVQSLFDFNLHIPSNAIAFSVIAGFLAASVRAEGAIMEEGGWSDGIGIH